MISQRTSGVSVFDEMAFIMEGLHVDGIENETGTLGEHVPLELRTVTVDPHELLGDGAFWGVEALRRVVGVDGIFRILRWVSSKGCELEGRATVEALSASSL